MYDTIDILEDRADKILAELGADSVEEGRLKLARAILHFERVLASDEAMPPLLRRSRESELLYWKSVSDCQVLAADDKI